MGLSSRIFLIDNDGVIYRMSNKRFARMLRHPEDEPLPDFANQRIRCADLVIELIDRVPTSVCRETFAVFEFDHQGRLDRGRFEKQQVALVDGKELFSWPGAGNFEDKEISQIVSGGAIGNGTFALHAKSIFQSRNARITYVGEATKNNRTVLLQ